MAVIGLQALDTAAPSLERRSGSAFSASTQEVAISVQSGERVKRQVVVPLPLAVLPAQPEVQPTRMVELAVLPAPRPDSTGPPPYDIQSWNPAPRGPPRA